MSREDSLRSAVRCVVAWPDYYLEGRRASRLADALEQRGWTWAPPPEQLELAP
jgi:hypothetical protein